MRDSFCFAAASPATMGPHRCAGPIPQRKWARCSRGPRRKRWSFQITICSDWGRLPGRSGHIKVARKAEYDLVIAGGGLAGCSAAIRALQAAPKSRILILERGRYPRQKVCGEFLSFGGVAVL